MADIDVTLSSGARLHVSSAPFADASALTKTLLKCVKGIPLGTDPLTMDLTILKDALIEAASSNEVEQALFKCASRASYNDIKVTPALFDDPKLGDQARQDYYEICWKVIEVNGGPFFVKAFSLFKARMGSATASPKSQ